jgi:hypothetical protein
MIDWRIVISEQNQEFPEGCNATNDSCYFPDWGYQDRLAPYFKTNGAKHIVHYDDVFFSGQELEQLQNNLEIALQQFTNQSSKSHTVSREVLQKTIEMIARAQKLNAGIFFRGD